MLKTIVCCRSCRCGDTPEVKTAAGSHMVQRLCRVGRESGVWRRRPQGLRAVTVRPLSSPRGGCSVPRFHLCSLMSQSTSSVLCSPLPFTSHPECVSMASHKSLPLDRHTHTHRAVPPLIIRARRMLSDGILDIKKDI